MYRLNTPKERKVSGIERQQTPDSMYKQESSQAGVMSPLASHLAAADEFQPSLQDIRGVTKQWELLQESPDCFSGCRTRPAQAVDCLRPGRHGPEFHQDLRCDEHRLAAGKQVFHSPLCDSMFRALLFGKPQEHIGVEQAARYS
jgi:hypothetical protein